ncbi:ornithine--oxo-acid transaminase [Timonella sp. A28]|uniref:ornithine--oxo-acid transaminase n=1 Tax=Timonella sp. A28 TaxID=3442640 RepID=UPI003EB91EA7
MEDFTGTTGVTRLRTSRTIIDDESRYLAHNYRPLPVVITEGDGAWVTDVEGRRYLDALCAYSALNFGHRNPSLMQATLEQLGRITLTSRAFHNDQLGPFAEELCALTGYDMMLPMNTGAEAVETALKLARLWGYRVKGVRPNRAEIIVASGNFHGRTISLVSFSDDVQARAGFGPYTPGFVAVPYGDADALEQAITKNTVAVLLEPIQGEAGVLLPPDGYLAQVRRSTERHAVLLIADEVQSGLGRTGATLETERVGVRPDLVTLGKALGGGVVPVSAVVGNRDVMGVVRPGEHGSTFGGNPLACSVGRAVVALLDTGVPQANARWLGAELGKELEALTSSGVVGYRQVGLWAGIDVDPALGSGRDVCEALLRHGVLAKDTHGSTLRLAPPLTLTDDELDYVCAALTAALDELA